MNISILTVENLVTTLDRRRIACRLFTTLSALILMHSQFNKLDEVHKDEKVTTYIRST